MNKKNHNVKRNLNIFELSLTIETFDLPNLLSLKQLVSLIYYIFSSLSLLLILYPKKNQLILY